MTDSKSERPRRAERITDLLTELLMASGGPYFRECRLRVQAELEALAALPLPGEAQEQTATCWCDRLRAAGGGATVQCPPCLARRAGEALQQQAQDYKSHLAGLGKWQQRCAQAEHRITDLERENASLRYLHAAPEALERQIRELKQRITELEAQLANREALDPVLARQAVESAQRIKELEDRWQPIETAPREEALLFWVIPKTPEESYVNTSGDPIFATFTPYIHRGKYRTWSSLSKATHWMPMPAPPVRADVKTTDIVDAGSSSLEGREVDPARSEEQHPAKPLMEGQLHDGIVQLERATKDATTTEPMDHSLNPEADS